MNEKEQVYYSKKEISEIYGFSVSKIDRAMKNGLHYQKFGVTVRIKLEDVDKYYKIKKEE